MTSIVYMISSDKIGNQDPDLGSRLMSSLLMKLLQADTKPTHLLFVEKGVHLLLPESPAQDALALLERQGVELLACQTCLDYYDIKDKISVGKVSNMPDIIMTMHDADKVISL